MSDDWHDGSNDAEGLHHLRPRRPEGSDAWGICGRCGKPMPEGEEMFRYHVVCPKGVSK